MKNLKRVKKPKRITYGTDVAGFNAGMEEAARIVEAYGAVAPLEKSALCKALARYIRIRKLIRDA